MSSKKILIFNRSLDEGGIDVVGTELARFLAPSFEVHLAVLFTTSRKKTLPKVTIHVLDVPPATNYFQKLFNIYHRFNAFRRLTADLQPDIVIAEGNLQNVLVGLDRRFGASYYTVFTIHNVLSQDLHGITGLLELRALRIAAPFADKWVAVSKAAADDSRQLFNISNIAVIHNSVRPPKKSTAKLPGSFILAAGRLAKQKDFPTLIRAFRIVADRHRHIKLLIAGAPETGQEKNQKELEAFIRSFDLKDRVMLLGQITNLPDYLHSCQFFVMSSIYEGLPIVALEALALGKAVVATDVPGIHEAVGDAGLYSAIGNEQALAKNIERLLMDEKLRVSLEKKALDQFKNFTPAISNKSWVKVLTDI